MTCLTLPRSVVDGWLELNQIVDRTPSSLDRARPRWRRVAVLVVKKLEVPAPALRRNGLNQEEFHPLVVYDVTAGHRSSNPGSRMVACRKSTASMRSNHDGRGRVLSELYD